MYICVDFDGTLVEHDYPKVGKPVPMAVEYCKEFVDNGCHLILWTMRSGWELDDAYRWTRHQGIKLFGVNDNPTQYRWTSSNKAYGNIYIDDAALGCPLVWKEGIHRPYVDWTVVGPWVMEIINEDDRVRRYTSRCKREFVTVS